MSDNQRPKRLTAQRKFELYLGTRAPEAPLGEILRRYGACQCSPVSVPPMFGNSVPPLCGHGVPPICGHDVPPTEAR